MNKIFKTIWNRARRSYVAVNEAVYGAAQADGIKRQRALTLTHVSKAFVFNAVFLAVLNANAELVTDNIVINSNAQYSDLTVSGTASGGELTIQTDVYKWAQDNGILGWDSFSKTTYSFHSQHSQLQSKLQSEISEFSSWFRNKFNRSPQIIEGGRGKLNYFD